MIAPSATAFDWIQLLVTLGAVVAAILAWLAKLVWSKEYRDAQDRIVSAKDAQIETLEREIQSLRGLTPMKLREYFDSVKEQLEEYNEQLKGELTKAQQEIADQEARIAELKVNGTTKDNELRLVEDAKGSLEAKARRLENQLSMIRGTFDHVDPVLLAVLSQPNPHRAFFELMQALTATFESPPPPEWLDRVMREEPEDAEERPREAPAAREG